MAPNICIPYDELPSRLYRVHCPSYSVTAYSSRGGFQSRDASGNDFYKMSVFLSAVREHLNWSSEKASPFISTFSRKSHALGWAKRWLNKPHRNIKTVQVMEIDPTKLVSAVISVKEIVDQSPKDSILPSSRSERQVEDEFLCLYQIPDWAFVDIEEVNGQGDTVHARSWEHPPSVVNIIDVDMDVEMGGMESQHPLVEYVSPQPSSWGYNVQTCESEWNNAHAHWSGVYQEVNQWDGYHGGNWGAAKHDNGWPTEGWESTQFFVPPSVPKIKFDQRSKRRRR